ncbi:RNA-splicing factor [Coemansia umbellata]|uniref:RNA-splicing factor n=1 Tax=Coemansia umbellata TaxID=1424467 RepID=A0ABQ8PU34_9FUNG|nr:RNA-splicing factor [Coemansia umbellata]
MYNGIGLTTPRGTGTSGHVVRNASSLKPGQEQGTSQNKHQQYARERIPKSKPVDKGILEHERKRQIEVKCLALQDKLEEQGLDEEAVEQHINKFRSQLLENIDHLDLSGGKDIKPFETQKLAEAKSKENHKLANALRVDDGYVEGAAFDRELQELKRQKRLLELEKERAAEREERYSSHRPVEDGEPGEIEDIDAGSNRAEDSKTHKSNDLSDNESAFVDSN